MFIVELVFGFVLANVVEWLVHKHILHGLGKNKSSIWSFHWHTHHRACRTENNRDHDYDQWFWTPGFWQASGKEVKGLLLLAVTQIPWLWFFPGVFIAVCIHILGYYYVHRKCHVDVEWGKKYLRHHYDHHMGRDQDKNYGVTYPLADYLFGTRVKYEYDDNGRPKKNPVNN